MVGAFSETEHRYHTHGGPRPRGSAWVPNQSRPSRWTSRGLEPCRRSRPARDAAPTIAPTIFCRVTGCWPWSTLALVLTGAALDVRHGRRAHRRGPRCAGPGRRAHRLAVAGPGLHARQLPRIQPDALDAPDFVGIGAKPTRQDGQRGRRNGGGSPWVPCQLARPRPRWTT